MSMRALAKPMPQNEATAQTVTVPAPVGGWNARDSLAAMNPLDAVVLDNIFPGTSDVSLRPGYVNWLTAIPANAKSLLPYNYLTGQKLFVSTNSGIYDATSAGVCGAAVNACTDGKWESVNFTNAAGTSYLLAVNGVDNLRNYDGTTWVNVTGVSANAITGLATTSLSNIMLFKRRVWFIEKNSMNLWYLPTDAMSGALTAFPIGQLFNRGGYLVSFNSWTVDSGSGSDDYFVAVTSEGELAVYKGTDPASSATWALVGVYYIGHPIGKKCLVKYGGDLLYLSQQGLTPLSKFLQSTVVDRSARLSFKIDGAFLDATTTYGNIFGWSIIPYPEINALIVNVPVSADTLSYQYVMNDITKAWCRFFGWNATAWAIMGDNIYFAGGNLVAKAWAGTADGSTPITGQVAQAYNNLGIKGQTNVVLTRPNIAVAGSAQLVMALDADYKVFGGSTTVSYAPMGSGALWDTSLWGTGVWDSGLSAVESKWVTVPNDLGYLHSLRLQLTTSTARFSWTSTDFAVRRAGIL